jgi:hypothetical protein
VDPEVLTTAMPGFSEFAQFYGKYRVLASSISAEATNSSATVPVKFVICPQNRDPTGSPTGSYIERLLEQPYAHSCTVGLVGSPVAHLNHSITTAKMNGTRATVYADSQVGSTDGTVTPSNDWYWVVGCYNFGSGGTFAIHIRIEVEVEFFDRLNLLI